MFTPCVMSTAKHVVVLWREGGISDPDETVQAYMDAARQFEVIILDSDTARRALADRLIAGTQPGLRDGLHDPALPRAEPIRSSV